jgi:hypothetical protein
MVGYITYEFQRYSYIFKQLNFWDFLIRQKLIYYRYNQSLADKFLLIFFTIDGPW